MESKKKHINKYFYQVSKIAQMIDKNEINELVKNIVKIKLGEKKYKLMGEMPSIVSLAGKGPPPIAVLEQALNRFVEDYVKNKGH